MMEDVAAVAADDIGPVVSKGTIYESNRPLWEEMLRRTLLLAVCSHAGMPFAYYLAYTRHLYWAYAVILPKLLIFSVLENRLLDDFESKLEKAEGEELVKFYTKVKSYKESFWKPQLLSAVPNWLHFLLGLSEVLDTDLDAITAGHVWHYHDSHPEMDERFRYTWRRVPWIGNAVAELGLPRAMTALLIWSLSVQLYTIFERARRCRNYLKLKSKSSEVEPRGQRYCVISSLGHVADVGNAHMLRDVLMEMRLEEKPHFVLERGAAFWAKVVNEACPNSWLSISLLSYAWDHHTTRQLAPLFIGLSTSTCVQVKVTWSMLKILPSLLSGADRMRFFVWIILLSTVISCFVLVANAIRFAGIWYCDSHVFNLSSGCIVLQKLDTHFHGHHTLQAASQSSGQNRSA
eukprot:TRINITY_DN69219_c0_g1_i1.p1 TRINITY_DN69219_c0_g1~~TRINITY_DN69219_c0_g1_i1.p1  ORF type:complete len:443 (+),score=65.96 TRINITY_DN69219_c0_g1_i1:119-1330(+)